jgi:hypothetical protein
MDDALKRLDKLTQEEARMAIAQNLKATHTVDERVRDVANTVVAIDDRVARVDDKVASVDDNVKGIDARVAIVDDSVKVVDDKVAKVIQGAQAISVKPEICLIEPLRRKGSKGSHKTDGQ